MLQELVKLGFSPIEAKVYLVILDKLQRHLHDCIVHTKNNFCIISPNTSP